MKRQSQEISCDAVRRCLLALAFLASAAWMRAQAQILDPPRNRSPIVWTSLSVGYVDAGTVSDGRTQSDWIFGGGVRYRGSIELPLRNESGFGIAGTWGSLPLTYVSGGGRENADADVWSLQATFHAGGGLGFHQVLEVAAGIANFGNFRSERTGERLPPLDGDRDFTFGLGYGFGYSVSPAFQVVLVQDFAYILHQRDGLPGGSSGAALERTTRIGVRYALGSRATR